MVGVRSGNTCGLPTNQVHEAVGVPTRLLFDISEYGAFGGLP